MSTINGNTTDLHHFADATLEELEEIIDLLPDLRTKDLIELEQWVAGQRAYMPLQYETGTQWLIQHLRRRV